MSETELVCPVCGAGVAPGATRCPDAACGVPLVRCGNPECAGLLGPADRFCGDCRAPAPATAPAPPVAADTRAQGATNAPAPATRNWAETVLAAAQTNEPELARIVEPTPGAIAVPAPVTVAKVAPEFSPSPDVSGVLLHAEYLAPWVIKEGKRAFLQVRVLANGREPVSIRLRLVCSLFNPFEAAEVAAPGAPTAFPSVAFEAEKPGAALARVVLSAFTLTGVPLGRWAADLPLTIKADTATLTINKSGSGSGDIVVYGTPGLAPGATDSPLEELEPAWRPLPLTPDQGFATRLARMRPRSTVSPPPGAPAPHGRALVELDIDGVRTTVVMARGPEVTVGRGGKPETAWWVRTEPFNQEKYLLISGLHARLSLGHGHAWVTDHSKHGTRLNDGDKLPGETATPLADGDVLTFATGFRCRVGLAAGADGVGALWLARTDTLAGRLAYALTTGPVPVPVFVSGSSAPTAWLAWTAGPNRTAVLHYRAADASDWAAVPPDAPTDIGAGVRVGWRAVAAPHDQKYDLNPVPPILT